MKSSVFAPFTILFSLAVVASGQTISSTITTAPASLIITIDGASFNSPKTVDWVPGTAHVIAVGTPQAGTPGTRYVFTSWNDGSTAGSRVIIAPASSTTITASFRPQYLLTTEVPPAGGGYIIGGGSIVPSPASADGYYDPGVAVEMTATPAEGFHFSFFSGDLVGTNNPQSVIMSAPRSVAANFAPGTGGNVPPYSIEIAPFQGAGSTQIFTGTFNDADGWTDITKASFRFHESYAGSAGACIVEMRPQTGQVTLLDDAGVNYLAPVALGSATPLQNGACSVNAASSSFSGSGNVLTVNVALTFKPAFGSAGGREPRKAICQWAKDRAGAGEDQSCLGMWLPEAPSPVKIPRYRLYFPQNYEHFFTASQNERDTLVSRGMQPEDPPPGMTYNQPATITGVPTQPFYRVLYIPTDPRYSLFHYWTRDREEYKAAVRVRGLNIGEGVDSFLLSAQVPGTYPTLRLRFTAGPSPFPIYHYALQQEHDALLGMGWGVSLGVDGYLQPFVVANDQVSAAKAPSARVDKRISAVLSAASHESGAVAPGQLVRVYRRDLSKFAQAFIDGSAVPLTAITDKYVELPIPETVAGKESIELCIDDFGVRSEPVSVPVVAARPAVFVKDFIGRGHIETLPSEPGTVTLQVTGAGELELGWPKLPLAVRLNGYPADIISISAINDQPGRLAVNVKLPVEVLDSDVATVSLQAGEAYAQPGLLVRVK